MITIGLTVFIIQNTGQAEFTILFVPVMLPKLVVLTAVSISAFLLGILVSRPRRKVKPTVTDDQYDDEQEVHDDQLKRRPDTLSDEDREYIS